MESREICVKQSWIMARVTQESAKVSDIQVQVERAEAKRHLCASAGFCGLSSREACGIYVRKHSCT